MRAQVLLTDAFGGHGGIAKFNRDLLASLCAHPKCESVAAFPRLMPDAPGPLPDKLAYVTGGLGGKAGYLQCVLRESLRAPRPDLMICAHINLLPIARALQMFNRPPPVLVIHGVDAWRPPRGKLAGRIARNITTFISVSDFTRQRFLGWAGAEGKRGFILPNSVDLEALVPGEPDARLLAQHRLAGRKVIMTLARLSSAERYKGIDEVLEALPALSREIPNLSYLIGGDGDDRERLEKKAADLKMTDRVVFAGRIGMAEKAAFYRLADAFVMPGWGEGFGIVYLEAMACGIPVVASKLDASGEALLDGRLGILVDPRNAAELHAGILEALRRPKGRRPDGLDYFSFPNYRRRCHEIVDQVLAA